MTSKRFSMGSSALLFGVLMLWPQLSLGQTPSVYQQYMSSQAPAQSASAAVVSGQGENASLPMQAASGPQNIAGISLPSFGDVMNNLKDKAMGMVEGCDYAKYMEMANQLTNNSSLLKGLNPESDRRFAMPVMDPINLFTRAFGTQATVEGAKAETTSLVYMLESTCNAVRQADETNRQLQIVEAGRVNIGNAVSWLAGNVKLQLFPENPDVQTQERKARVAADFGAIYEDLNISRIQQRDSAWAMVTERISHTLKLAEEYDKALDQIEQQLKETKKDLFLYPEPDTTGKGMWMCPEGYPNLNTMAPRDMPKDHDGKTVCGPATPERSTQVLTHLTYLNSHIRALEINIMSQTMQVEAVRLAADNQARKEEERVRFDANTSF